MPEQFTADEQDVLRSIGALAPEPDSDEGILQAITPTAPPERDAGELINQAKDMRVVDVMAPGPQLSVPVVGTLLSFLPRDRARPKNIGEAADALRSVGVLESPYFNRTGVNLEEQAENYAWLMWTQLGLIDDQRRRAIEATPELWEETKSAYRMAVVAFNAPHGEEGGRALMANAKRELFTHIQRGLEARIQEVQANNGNVEYIERLAADASLAGELAGARNDDAQVLDAFSYLASESIDRYRMVLPPNGLEVQQLDLDRSLMSDMAKVKEAAIAVGESEGTIEFGPEGTRVVPAVNMTLIQRMRGLIERALTQNGADNYAPDRAVLQAWQGALREDRARKMGIPESQLSVVGIGNSIMFTDPDLSNRLLEAAERAGAKRTLGVPPEEVPPAEFEEKIADRIANTKTYWVSRMVSGGISPLLNMGMIEVEPMKDIHGTLTRWAQQWVAAPLGRVLEMGNTLRKVIINPALREEIREHQGNVGVLDFGISTAEAYERLRTAQQQEDPDTPNVGITSWWAEEGLFNPDADPLTSAAVLIGAGETGQILESFEGFNLSRRRLRQTLRDRLRQRFENVPLLNLNVVREQRDQAQQRMGKHLRNLDLSHAVPLNPLKFSDNVNMIVDAVKASIFTFQAEALETAALITTEPEQAGNLATALVGAKGIGFGSRGLRVELRDLATRGIRSRATAKTIRNAVATDASAAEDALRLMDFLPADERSLTTLRANLETIRDYHKPRPLEKAATARPAAQIDEFSDAAIEVERVLKKISPDRLGTMLEGLGADATTMESIHRLGIGGFLGRLANTIKVATVGEGFEVPTFIKRRSEKVAAKIQDAIDAGVSPPDWGELPLSFDALDLAGTPARRRIIPMLQRLEARHPGRFRIARLGDGGQMRRLVDWYTNFNSEVMEQRALVSERLTDIDDFMSTHLARKRVEVQDALIREAVGPTPRNVERSARLRTEFGERNRMREDIASRVWDEPVMLKNLDFVDDIDANELGAWALRRKGIERLYADLGLPGEEFGAFETRLRTLFRRSSASGNERRKLNRQADRLKRDILNTYLDSPGLTDEIFIDLDNSSAVTRRQMLRKKRKIKREILEANPDIDDDELDATIAEELGIKVTNNTRPIWRAMKKQAELEKVAGPDTKQAIRLMERMQDLGAGLPTTQAIQQMHDLGVELKLNAALAEVRSRQAIKKIRKLPKDQRRALQLILARWEKTIGPKGEILPGRFVDVEAARKIDAEVAALLGPGTDLQKIQALLDEATDFQKTFAQTYGEAVGGKTPWDPDIPYIPRRHMIHEQDRFTRVPRTAELEQTISPEGLDLGFTQAARDTSHFKAIVNVRGGAPVTKLFPDEDAARQWIQQRWGGERGKTTRARGLEKDLEGKTGFGDNFSILQPMGKARARALGLVTPEKGLAVRWLDQAFNLPKLRFFRLLDRPGWTFTESEWQAHRATARGSIDARRGTYVRVPNTPRYGPLAGKRIHKDAARQIFEFEEGHQTVRMMAEAAEVLSQNQNAFMAMLSKPAAISRGVGGVIKRLVVTNKIQRNFKVVANNVLGDHMLFAPAAVGPGYLVKGFADRGAARRDLWQFMMRDEPVESRIFSEAMQDGVIDDFAALGIRHGAESKQTLNDLFFGVDDSSLPKRVRAFVGAVGGGEFRKANDALGAMLFTRVPETPRLRGLMAERDKIQAVIDRNSGAEGVRPTLTPRELAERRDQLTGLEEQIRRALGQDPDTGKSSFMQRWGNATSSLWGWLSGAPGGILRDKELFSAKLYSLINNHARLSAYYYARRVLKWDRTYAAQQINRFMQTYSRVPREVRRLSGHLLSNPVISFQYEAARITANLLLHKWPIAAAWFMTVPAINMIQMARSGIDPFYAAEAMKGQSPQPGWAWMYKLMVPNGDGTFSTAWPSSLLPAGFFTRNNPTLNRFIQQSEGPPSALQEIGGEIGGALMAGIFGNPLVDSLANFAQLRDPSNGRPVDTRTQAFIEAAAHFVASSTPPETPFLGSSHAAIIDNNDKPSYASTGRHKTLAQKVIGLLSGVHLEGTIGETPETNAFARAMTFLLGGTVDLPKTIYEGRLVARPLRNDVAKAIGYQDYLIQNLFLSRDLETGQGAPDFRLSAEDAKGKLARDLMRDPENAAEGKRLQREVLDRAQQKLEDQLAAMDVDVDLSKAAVTQRELTAVQRYGRSLNFDEQFKAASIARQAYVVSHAALRPEVPDQVFANLVALSLFEDMTAGSFTTRNRTNLQSLEVARAMVGDALRDYPIPDKRRQLMSLMLAGIEEMRAKALARFANEVTSDDARLEIWRELAEEGKIRGDSETDR